MHTVEGHRRTSLLPQRSNRAQVSASIQADNHPIPIPTVSATVTHAQRRSSSIALAVPNKRSVRLPTGSSVSHPAQDPDPRKPSDDDNAFSPSSRGLPAYTPTHVSGQNTKIGLRSSSLRPVTHHVGQSSVQGMPRKIMHTEKLLSKRTKPILNAMPEQSSTTHTPSPPSETGMNSGPARGTYDLQVELSQLALLHQYGQPTLISWEQSAKASFQSRFEALRDRHMELKEIATQQQALVNQLALLEWSESKQVAEAVQSFSKSITDLESLLGPDGKYTQILNVFEHWFNQNLRIRRQRNVKSDPAKVSFELSEGLGDEWKTEVLLVERELTYCLRDVKSFGVIRSNSSLGHLQSIYSRLIDIMIEELDTIQWLENKVITLGTGWDKDTVQRLASDVMVQAQ